MPVFQRFHNLITLQFNYERAAILDYGIRRRVFHFFFQIIFSSMIVVMSFLICR